MKEFFKKCDGWNNAYLTITIVNSTLEKVLKATNYMWNDREEELCYNGKEYDDGVIEFDVSHIFPFTIATLATILSNRLKDAIVYVDLSWDNHEFHVYRNGKIYHAYTVKWQKEEPTGYKEEYENVFHYDCDVIIKDNLTGHEIITGGGMCTQEEFDYYKKMIEQCKKVNYILPILQHIYSESSTLLTSISAKDYPEVVIDVLAELSNFCKKYKNNCGTHNSVEMALDNILQSCS